MANYADDNTILNQLKMTTLRGLIFARTYFRGRRSSDISRGFNFADGQILDFSRRFNFAAR